MTVHHFPVRNPALLADLLSRDAIRSGPVDAIRQPGSLCATGELAEKLERVEAIVHAMAGPGRVYLVDGIEVAIALLEAAHAAACAEVMTSERGSARQVTP